MDLRETRPADAELDAMLRLLEGEGARLVNVGHGRSPASAARARAFLDAWPGDVGAVVSWPAAAASWLRPARRLAAGAPDAWVIADEPAGWAGIGPRLAATGLWRAHATFAFTGLAGPRLPALAGPESTEGLRGVTAGGRIWEINDGAAVFFTARGTGR
ncbi:hypothetical protein ACGFNU_20190 [Spirillospora sp. NPDC048911]|uniref:hypothetical protein n=1 Tax=Spirillospora sp. NPDC048911 TaxID=3364527 RepID=UPI003713B38F